MQRLGWSVRGWAVNHSASNVLTSEPISKDSHTTPHVFFFFNQFRYAIPRILGAIDNFVQFYE